MYSSLRIKRLSLKDFLSLSRYKDLFHFAIEMIEQTFELLLCQLPSECTITKSIIWIQLQSSSLSLSLNFSAGGGGGGDAFLGS